MRYDFKAGLHTRQKDACKGRGPPPRYHRRL